MKRLNNEGIYADNNSTTPVDPRVKKAIQPYLEDKFGNPNNLHKFGREAEEAVEGARDNVASVINAEPSEIVFTSCGSEGNNLAIKGAMDANEGNHIITSEIEHECVLGASEHLEKEGYDVTYLDVDNKGRVDPNDVKDELRDDTVIVSIMLANNEIGTIQPIGEIAEILEDKDTYLHTDAVQAIGKMPVDVKELGVDMLTMSGHKIYATKGVGALYVKNDVKLGSLIDGGQQEGGLRAGTENVPEIVGFGKACEIAEKTAEEEQKRLTKLHEKLLEEIPKRIDDVRVNGDRENRLPGNANFCFKYIEGESLIMMMDSEGIAASTGSACSSESLEASHVLIAIDVPKKVAHGSLRIGLGRFNTEEDVDRIIEVVPEKVERLREMTAVNEEDFQ